MAKDISDEIHTGWYEPTADDVQFIKSKLRYPINKRLAAFRLSLVWQSAPALVFVGGAVAGFVAPHFYPQIAKELSWAAAGVSFALLLAVLLSVRAKLKRLEFTELLSQNGSRLNAHLLREFFIVQHLAYYQAAGTPEVFQIMTNPPAHQKIRKEIIVFVVDDDRMLINNHHSGETRLKRSTHHALLISRLEKWLAYHGKSSAPYTASA